MSDLTRGWTPVYPHLRYRDPEAAIAWLVRVFGFRERVRAARPDGSVVTAKLETPGGGLVMVAALSEELVEWLRRRLRDLRVPSEPGWPNLTHVTTVLVDDLDAHHRQAAKEGATILMPPTTQPWGLRVYVALDPDGHQWEFAQVLRLLEPETWGAVRR